MNRYRLTTFGYWYMRLVLLVHYFLCQYEESNAVLSQQYCFFNGSYFQGCKKLVVEICGSFTSDYVDIISRYDTMHIHNIEPKISFSAAPIIQVIGFTYFSWFCFVFFTYILPHCIIEGRPCSGCCRNDRSHSENDPGWETP